MNLRPKHEKPKIAPRDQMAVEGGGGSSKVGLEALKAFFTVIVWTTNAQGEVVDIPCWRKFTGQSKEEIRGKGWLNALHPDDRDRVFACWSHAVETRSLYDTEYRVRRADGTYRVFAVRGVPVLDPDGGVHKWAGTCVDITDRKQAEAEVATLNQAVAQRANQLRVLATELTLAEQKEQKRLAQILHDGLQQLLVGAKYGLESIGRRNATDEGLVVNLRELDALMREAIQLCRSLVVELNPTVLNEVGLVAAVTCLRNEMKRLHGLDIRIDSHCEIPLDADGVVLLLFQAVRELLFNVAKHAGVKVADVKIQRTADNEVHIEVADAGAGFDPGAINRSSNSATGFGLFSIQERLAVAGGRMEVESAPGHGTRITLRIAHRPTAVGGTAELGAGRLSVAPHRSPETASAGDTLAKDTFPPAPSPAGVSATGQAGMTDKTKFKVLLVEDSPIVAQYFTEALMLAGGNHFEIVHKDRMSEATIMLKEQVFDVLLLDLSLPDSRGMDTIRLAHAASPHTPIVVLSAEHHDVIKNEAIRQGAHAYVVKGEASAWMILQAINQAIDCQRHEKIDREVEVVEMISATPLQNISSNSAAELFLSKGTDVSAEG